MTPEQVLSIEPKVLTQKQREFYFENGYLLLEKFLPDRWIERLRAATDQMVDKSRSITKSDAVWDLDKGHTAASPRLRRLSSMNDHHPTFWEYASSPASPLPDAIADRLAARLERPAERRRSEGRIDHQRQAMAVRDVRDGGQVGHLEARIAECLGEDEARLRPDRAAQPVVLGEGVSMRVGIEAKTEISADGSQPVCEFPATAQLAFDPETRRLAHAITISTLPVNSSAPPTTTSTSPRLNATPINNRVGP